LAFSTICSRDSGGRVALLAGRVADHPGEVPDEEHHVVAELLKVAQLVDENGMAEMQVGSGGVEAGLDAQRAAGLEFFDQVGFDQEFIGTALERKDANFSATSNHA
jgi:hypothetical protein